MRDPERLFQKYGKMCELHKNKLPDWRIGQMIINFLSWYYIKNRHDCFYIEDSEFIKSFEEFIQDITNPREE